MLAQNFKTAADLGISEVEVQSLIKVLGMLERGEIDLFSFRDHGSRAIAMHNFFEKSSCGTVACICGWAHIISGKQAFPELGKKLAQWQMADRLRLRLPDSAQSLFYLDGNWRFPQSVGQIAIALRSYLTTGDARWDLALTD